MTLARAETSSPPTANPADGRFGLYELMLYAITVFAWSTSWFAVRQQLGPVAAEVSVTWRFVLSAALMWAWVLIARLPIRFGFASHLRFAALGLVMFSCNFLMMYYASAYLPSGLLSVVFALSSVFNLLISRIFVGTQVKPQIALGGCVGIAGVGLMFWPQIAGAQLDLGALKGLGFALAGTLFFSSGNLFSARLQRDQVPVMSANAWGMLYGALILAFLAWMRGAIFTIDLSPRYLGSLVYLAVTSSGIAYWSYLTLLGRIGSARAGYAAVMFPVFALLISTVFENYHWTLAALTGIILALAGNVLVLSAGSRK